ncbi:hypothetical protein ACFLZH_04465 [Patescibacteria group bacterium]
MDNDICPNFTRNPDASDADWDNEVVGTCEPELLQGIQSEVVGRHKLAICAKDYSECERNPDSMNWIRAQLIRLNKQGKQITVFGKKIFVWIWHLQCGGKRRIRCTERESTPIDEAAWVDLCSPFNRDQKERLELAPLDNEMTRFLKEQGTVEEVATAILVAMNLE